MIPRKEPSPEILRLAQGQSGVISHAQLDAAGAPAGARQRWRREWHRLARGIHGLRAPDWNSWVWAGQLYADGVVGGAAAGHLHGFISTPPPTIIVWHAGKGSIADIGDDAVTVRFRRGSRDGVGSPTRTRVEQTLLDLASDTTESEFIMALTRAIAGGHTLPDRVLDLADQRMHLERRRMLEDVLDAASSGVESVLELRFLQHVVKAHGLPEPQLQQVLVAGTRSDATWLEFRVVVELDGRLGHDDSPFRDMHRDNRLVLQGMATLRFGWYDVLFRPCLVARQILDVLRMNGYSGKQRRCAHCGDARR